MSKHTPGPWKIKIEKKPRYCSDTGARQEDSQSIFIESDEAYVGCMSTYKVDPVANARLVSAAPELLDALKGLLDHAYSPISQKEERRWQIAREVIAKVEAKTESMEGTK